MGERAPTGLAVLDDHARLVHVSAVRDDDEIEAELAAYVAGDCLVGIDAPLVVKNATGSRPAEKALSKDFRRFDAGTHPSNTGKPEFAEGTRGARVSKRLKLDIDPRSGRARRAIEVYPHAASVVLFGLDKILKYKKKKGRDLELLRSELLLLMTFVEGIVTTDEAWAGCAARSSARPARASCVSSRTRSTPWSAPTSRSSRTASPTRSRRTATSRPATSSPRRSERPRARSDVVREAVRAYAAEHADLTAAGARGGRAGAGDPRRGRHQLPLGDRAHQDRALVRGEGRPAVGRRAALRRSAAPRSPTRSASG